MHVWNEVTPADKILQTLGDFVRAGKIRYFGFSDMPAELVMNAVAIAAERRVTQSHHHASGVLSGRAMWSGSTCGSHAKRGCLWGPGARSQRLLHGQVPAAGSAASTRSATGSSPTATGPFPTRCAKWPTGAAARPRR
ncbi:aldo/keto reductase [Rubellimicrobium rubrum]|uniref:Aldo/keto reductase n=1 Tax=Rubellimicrobium rubrum TaxID=2585369 RepID=A0A5C4N490_9RHOB|nr:aldo/keto reductase [Rubellimicrobium rubrum]